jgi:hypothetical protein
LDVQQSRDEIIIKALRNGETAIARFPFKYKNSDQTRARWKGRVLLLEANNSIGGGHFDAMPVQKWELSANGQELIIHDNRVTGTIGSAYSEVYTPQPSLEAAQRIAIMSDGQICNQSLQQWFSKNTRMESDFKHGAELGVASFQQVTRCVLYDAVLSSDFFKNLERKKSSTKPEFRKADHIVTSFSGDLTLEISPHQASCSGSLDQFVSQGPQHPKPVTNLRFMVRWIGTQEKDIGEVNAEFLHQAWREQWPTDSFYRMRIPAEGILLTDDLEVVIFSGDGEKLACVKGHLQ